MRARRDHRSKHRRPTTSPACSRSCPGQDPEFALYLRLAAVTGARRRELCALKWTDLDVQGKQVVVARSLTVGDEGLIEKRTKTHRVRRLALDDATHLLEAGVPVRAGQRAPRSRERHHDPPHLCTCGSGDRSAVGGTP